MKEKGGRPEASSEVLKDRIHAVNINLLDDLPKSSGEIPDNSPSCLRMAWSELMFPFCRTEHKYWEMKAAHRSLIGFIDPLGSLWNQARAGPFRMAGNTLHMRRSLPALRIIVWLKCSIWSYGSVEPSYIANGGITKPQGGS